jgi:hypothetical protein
VVNSQDGSVFDIGAAQKRADQLSALRDQRMLLARVSDGVDGALRTFHGASRDLSWRSAAQRRYSERRAELDRQLVSVRRAVDEALAGVEVAIAVMSVVE